MIAARNSSTETSGPSVAKRSWRAGDWRRHQRPNSARARSHDGARGRRIVAGLHAGIIESCRCRAVPPPAQHDGRAFCSSHYEMRMAPFEIDRDVVRHSRAVQRTRASTTGDKPCPRMPESFLGAAANDADAQETREWLDALSAVIAAEGGERAHFLLEQLIDQARQAGIDMPFSANTGYVNTIPRRPGRALPRQPRDRGAPARLHALERDGDGGQGQPAASGRRRRPRRPHLELRLAGDDVRHRLQPLLARRDAQSHGGDLLYIQGHSSPGIYARAFMEGRLTEEQLLNFRQEVDGKGISSYPHPKLMPEFWQFPTVSMGLGPLMAIYQARFLKYLHARGIANTENRKVWVFCGDGEMDEPESLGAIGLAAREKLDNLIFVVNCNLQRLDGPVRGNGKIIQELEGEFRGSGWNVIKLIWGSYWDPLLARDKDGILRKVMMDTVDGDYQAMKANDGAFVRKHFFGQHPKLLEMVAKMSDDDIWRLNRGGHDPQKVYAAFHRAVNTRASRRCC